MKKRWLDAYPPGVPAEIDPHAFASLGHLLDHSARRFRKRDAFTSMGASITYGELDRLSRDFGAWLQMACAMDKGERLAIMLPNLLQYPVALFAALRAGLTVVNVNPLYTADELAHQLADSGATAIVVLENFAARLQAALAKTAIRQVITTQAGDLLPAPRRWIVNFAVKHVKRAVPAWHIAGATALPDALAAGAHIEFEDRKLGPQDLALLQYTGGTTGRPKGAMLSHGNLVANVEQTAAWIGPALKQGEETVVTALPLYHVFALTANLLVFVKLGGNNVLIADPRDLRGFVSTLSKTAFTAISGVNTLFGALLDTEGFADVAVAARGRLKVAVAGGMSVQRVIATRWQTLTGVPLIEGYGLTEASPIVCANRFDTPAFTGSLGLPVPSTEVSIRDDAGNEAPVGETGEICVRGPQVMRGYWNAPIETAAVFWPDGWLRTGDIGIMDTQGYVVFSDRRKDMIVVSGFKAYPTEIEDAVMLHPAVKEACAVGMPDEHSGEAVMLFVVRRDPLLTEQELKAHCARHLTGYKRPKTIVFCEQLPKTPIGKPLRRELRERALRGHG